MGKKPRISGARRRRRPELSESEPPPLSDFDKGVLHIVTLAEENLVKELGLPNREALAASGKIPAWWLATLMATKMPSGDIVMVKTFLNQPIKRRVYEASDRSVTICTEESWQSQILEGARIPRSKVFKWDEALFLEMVKFDEQLDDEPLQLIELWKKAIPY